MESAPVWLVEDDAIYVEAVRREFARLAGPYRLERAFATAEDALVAAASAGRAGAEGARPPRLVLLDVGLPGLSGIEAAPRLRTHVPRAALVMLTVSDDAETVVASFRAGASGYVVKGAPPEQLRAALEAALAGGLVVPAPFGRAVGALLGEWPAQAGGAERYGLTLREREVLRLLADGLPQKAIAKALFISVATVNWHLKGVYHKLRVSTAGAAVAKATREGLV